MSSLRRGVNVSNDRFSRNRNEGRGQGVDSMRDMIGNKATSQIREAIDQNPILSRIEQGYKKIEPFMPKINPSDKTIEYDYTLPVGPGQLNIGGEYDFDNDGYNLFGNYSFSFEEGGIVDTPQAQETIKKKLTDEQKDYLYDFMLDFMMKERLREQQEMESRVPPFNYFDMEV